MKKLLIAIVVLAAGCAQPTDKARAGDVPLYVYVRDLATGKCIELSPYLGGQREVIMRIAKDQSKCKLNAER